MESDKNEVDFKDSSTTYISEVLKIKNSQQQPETKLELLTILVKDYFRKKYHVSKSMGFSELINYFLDKKKPTLATYCHDIVNDLYSGDEMTENRINYILENTKIMITKDLSNKDVTADKISVKEVINPFSVLKDEKISKERILSKSARKLIEKYLKEEEKENLSVDLKEAKEEEKKEQDLESLKKKLSMDTDVTNEKNVFVKGDDPQKIESIDSFERLKERIKKKKFEN